MSWVILYRSLRTERVHCVVSVGDYGLMEFATLDDAIRHLEGLGLPEGTPTQIVETDEL